ncbi:MAG: [protein-PII] uridylyltransferase [Pseudomonadota bacterium]
MPTPPLNLIDLDAFDRALKSAAKPIPIFKQTLLSGAEVLREQFTSGTPVNVLVAGRAQLVDHLIVRAWRLFLPARIGGVALIAVGGYGRGELHPHSDVDIMILLRDKTLLQHQDALAEFLTFLWDIGLEVGHSVRTLEQCCDEARRDITVATNLMESRLLRGPQALFREMHAITGPEKLWPSRAFFEAKWREQIDRHLRFHDTAYNLEPNIKESPGGLRDIQVIVWVTKRHFGTATLADLVHQKFLTEDEYTTLMEGQEFLWRIRFALHVLTGRREDRLLFDHQRALAQQFGFQDERPHMDVANDSRRAADRPHLAVEQFMKKYYRTVMTLNRLNEMLLQLYQEAILYQDQLGSPTPINKRFQARKEFIEAIDDHVFKRYPFALLEVFLLLQQHPELKGIRAQTIRLIRESRHLIDDKFRNDIRGKSLFMEILRQPRGITHELRRMNRYGVLAAYIPAFARIVGQMQHDLFHVYTVDEHTLFVIRNLRRLTVDEYRNEFPLLSDLIGNIPKPELLYIAGLFHDIAKGRGGDHSVLGAEEVRGFCVSHGLSAFDTDLVAWLVSHHLLLSSTAQHQDISDIEVINKFASRVEDKNRLEYLYILTVSDIRATNPALWNGWKASILYELYLQTHRALERGLENPLDKRERIRDTLALVRKNLTDKGYTIAQLEQLWHYFDDDYFLRYPWNEISWHTDLILTAQNAHITPVIEVQGEGVRGGTEIFIYAPVDKRLFAMVTATVGRLGLNILEARIVTTRDGYAIETYQVLERNGQTIATPARLLEIKEFLQRQFQSNDITLPTLSRIVPRQIKHFVTPTEVAFTLDERNQRTIMELRTTDRPGILACVAVVMVECDVVVHNAKISTLGALVDDVFFITTHHNEPLRDPLLLDRLRKRIVEYLDTPPEQTNQVH